MRPGFSARPMATAPVMPPVAAPTMRPAVAMPVARPLPLLTPTPVPTGPAVLINLRSVVAMPSPQPRADIPFPNWVSRPAPGPAPTTTNANHLAGLARAFADSTPLPKRPAVKLPLLDLQLPVRSTAKQEISRMRDEVQNWRLLAQAKRAPLNQVSRPKPTPVPAKPAPAKPTQAAPPTARPTPPRSAPSMPLATRPPASPVATPVPALLPAAPVKVPQPRPLVQKAVPPTPTPVKPQAAAAVAVPTRLESQPKMAPEKAATVKPAETKAVAPPVDKPATPAAVTHPTSRALPTNDRDKAPTAPKEVARVEAPRNEVRVTPTAVNPEFRTETPVRRGENKPAAERELTIQSAQVADRLRPHIEPVLKQEERWIQQAQESLASSSFGGGSGGGSGGQGRRRRDEREQDETVEEERPVDSREAPIRLGLDWLNEAQDALFAFSSELRESVHPLREKSAPVEWPETKEQERMVEAAGERSGDPSGSSDPRHRRFS